MKNKMSASEPQDAASEFRARWRRYRIIVRVGQVLIGVGALVAIIHWLTHLEVFGAGQPPGWLDLAAGYPMGAVLVVVGAVLAGRKRPSTKA